MSITPKVDREPPSLGKQALVSAAFGGGMILSQILGNSAGSIIASDGFSQSLKNTMRCIEDLPAKCLVLGGGIFLAYEADCFTEYLGRPSLDLSSIGIGCGMKVLDREFNLYLAGKGKTAEGKKNKVKHSQAFLIAVVSALACLVFAANKANANPVLIDATLSAFSTAVKNATKKFQPIHVWGTLAAFVMTAMLIDHLTQSSSIMSKNSLTALALGLACKEAMRSVESVQMGDYAGDDDDMPIDKEQEAQDSSVVGPAPMIQQVMLTTGTLGLGLGAQVASEYVHPVLQSSIQKAGLRFFHNIMRQCSFSQSLPVIATATGVLIASGSVLNAKDIYPSLGKTPSSIGLGLPLGELKAWQLGKKIPAPTEVQASIEDKPKHSTVEIV